MAKIRNPREVLEVLDLSACAVIVGHDGGVSVRRGAQAVNSDDFTYEVPSLAEYKVALKDCDDSALARAKEEIEYRYGECQWRFLQAVRALGVS